MRFYYKKMTIHDRINYKSRRVVKLRDLVDSTILLKIIVKGCNWDEFRFGIKFQNPNLGNGNKAFRRLYNADKYHLCNQISPTYLLSSGFSK